MKKKKCLKKNRSLKRKLFEQDAEINALRLVIDNIDNKTLIASLYDSFIEVLSKRPTLKDYK